MNERYFIAARYDEISEDFVLADDDNNIMCEDIMEKSLNDIDPEDKDFESFVITIANIVEENFESEEEDTVVGLFDSDENDEVVFVWGIMIKYGDNDTLQFALMNLEQFVEVFEVMFPEEIEDDVDIAEE